MISRKILLKMRNASDESCRQNQNTHCTLISFFENRAVYEITWTNTVQSDSPHITI